MPGRYHAARKDHRPQRRVPDRGDTRRGASARAPALRLLWTTPFTLLTSLISRVTLSPERGSGGFCHASARTIRLHAPYTGRYCVVRQNRAAWRVPVYDGGH